MIIGEKQQVILRIFILIVVISLSIAVYSNAQNLSCDNCEIRICSKRLYGGEESCGKANAINLFEGFNEGICKLYWDHVNGWIYQE